MKDKFYRLRKGKWLFGIIAGLADSFHLDVNLLRILFLLFCFWEYGIGILIYVILAWILPYKEDKIEAEMREAYGTGPRKRKEAEKID